MIRSLLHWPDPRKVDVTDLEFCIKKEQNHEEKSIQ